MDQLYGNLNGFCQQWVLELYSEKFYRKMMSLKNKKLDSDSNIGVVSLGTYCYCCLIEYML